MRPRRGRGRQFLLLDAEELAAAIGEDCLPRWCANLFPLPPSERVMLSPKEIDALRREWLAHRRRVFDDTGGVDVAELGRARDDR